MEYLHRGQWCLHGAYSVEQDAVESSRMLWKLYGVAGVRVLQQKTEILHQAVRGSEK